MHPIAIFGLAAPAVAAAANLDSAPLPALHALLPRRTGAARLPEGGLPSSASGAAAAAGPTPPPEVRSDLAVLVETPCGFTLPRGRG